MISRDDKIAFETRETSRELSNKQINQSLIFPQKFNFVSGPLIVTEIVTYFFIPTRRRYPNLSKRLTSSEAKHFLRLGQNNLIIQSLR